MLILHCECGDIYRAEERHIGGKIRCGKCGHIILISKPTPAHNPSNYSATRTTASIDLRRSVSALFSNRIALIAVVGVLAIVFAIVVINHVQTSKPEMQQSKSTEYSPSSSPTQPSVVPSTSPSSIPELSRPPVSLANGTEIIRPRGSKGRGTLKVTNGTSYDAVVRLADSNSKKTRRLIYVRANSEFTIGSIGSCNCTLQFSTGTDWDGSKHKFLRDQSYSQFEDLFEFRETRTDYGVEWTVFEVTLNPVIDGNARTSSISESDFEGNGIDEEP